MSKWGFLSSWGEVGVFKFSEEHMPLAFFHFDKSLIYFILSQIHQLFIKLHPNLEYVTEGQLRYIIKRTEEGGTKKDKLYLEKPAAVFTQEISPTLSALGFTRESLLQGPESIDPSIISPYFKLLNLHIQALDNFRSKEKKNDKFVINWLSFFSKNNSELNSSKLAYKLKCFRMECTRFVQSSHRPHPAVAPHWECSS